MTDGYAPQSGDPDAPFICTAVRDPNELCPDPEPLFYMHSKDPCKSISVLKKWLGKGGHSFFATYKKTGAIYRG